MKIYGTYPRLIVDKEGMDGVLNACGYPIAHYMEKWDWKDWEACHEGERFVKDEAGLELEYYLSGIRAKELVKCPIPRYSIKSGKESDEAYYNWMNYLDELSWANAADALLDEFYSRDP